MTDMLTEKPETPAIADSRMKELRAKAAKMASKLSKTELQDAGTAFEVVKEIYPFLRLDTSAPSEGSYEDRRAAFKILIDRLECALSKLDKYFPEEIPTYHKFAPGMYVREIHVPAGTIFTSVTHKTQHPFVISQGVCDICNEAGEVTRYEAPHTGITNPGTRRVFLVHRDLVFTTFHATDITDPDEWLLTNTEMENETLPKDASIKCFNRKGLKWQQ